MGKTLGDYVRNFYRNYIAPTKEDVKIGKKEEKLVAGSGLFPEQKHHPFTKELTVSECINAAKQCPAFMKGARKKARDSIRAWHRIEHIDKKRKPFSIDLYYLDSFARRNNLQKLWEELRVASYVAGDGFLLITFENDEDTELYDPPTKDACPYKIRILNSKYITEIGYYPDQKKKYEQLNTKHFHYVDSQNNEDRWIHPDRIIHMTNDKLFGEFGNSKINLLRNIIKSNVNVDIATGEILAWFAHGLLDIKKQNLNEPERKEWEKTVNKHPSAYIHDEEVDIKAVEPKAIDPKPFYDYLVFSIAAAFIMPTHILTGIQIGKVTGAEIGTGDYVKDLKDDQVLDYNPLLERLYTMILKAKGRSWEQYEITWNPIYIDELSEAEIMIKRAQAADLAFNGTRGVGGFIDMSEARRIYNEGQIELEVEKDIKSKKTQTSNPAKAIVEPTEKAKQAMKEQGLTFDIQKPQLDEAAKIMIEKRKKQIKKEHDIGKKILKEQEKNDSTENKN